MPKKKNNSPSTLCDCCGRPSYVIKLTGDGKFCDKCVIEKDGQFFTKKECKNVKGRD